MSAVWHSKHVCCLTQQTCLLWDTADMVAGRHSRYVCCVTNQTCLLCDTADMSAMSHSRNPDRHDSVHSITHQTFAFYKWLQWNGRINVTRAPSGPTCIGTKERTLPYLPSNLPMRNCHIYNTCMNIWTSNICMNGGGILLIKTYHRNTVTKSTPKKQKTYYIIS